MGEGGQEVVRRGFAACPAGRSARGGLQRQPPHAKASTPAHNVWIALPCWAVCSAVAGPGRRAHRRLPQCKHAFQLLRRAGPVRPMIHLQQQPSHPLHSAAGGARPREGRRQGRGEGESRGAGRHRPGRHRRPTHAHARCLPLLAATGFAGATGAGGGGRAGLQQAGAQRCAGHSGPGSKLASAERRLATSGGGGRLACCSTAPPPPRPSCAAARRLPAPAGRAAPRPAPAGWRSAGSSPWRSESCSAGVGVWWVGAWGWGGVVMVVV